MPQIIQRKKKKTQLNERKTKTISKNCSHRLTAKQMLNSIKKQNKTN